MVGIKDFISIIENGVWSLWFNVGSVFDCFLWIFEMGMVNFGEIVI